MAAARMQASHYSIVGLTLGNANPKLVESEKISGMSAIPTTRLYLKRWRRPFAAMSVCFSIFLGITATYAQGYPSRPIRLIVPYPPGGGTDLVARLLGQRILAATGQTVVVENKPGASEIVGTDLVAHSPGDGYTLLLMSNTFSINAALHQKLPYQPDDLKPVAKIVDVPFALIVNPMVPFATVSDLVAFAKVHPGQLNCAHIGLATPHYMTLEWFNVVTGSKITPVAYGGSGPAFTAVLSNEVQMIFAGLGGATQFLKTGKLKALAVTSAKRVESEPNLPTLAEAGVPGIDMTAWFGVMAPASTPKDVVARLNELFHQALADHEIADRLSGVGMESAFLGSDEFSGIIKRETDNWSHIVEVAGIKPDQK